MNLPPSEAQSEPQDLAPVANLAGLEAPIHASAQGAPGESATRKRRNDLTGLDHSESVAAAKDAAIPRKRRKKEAEVLQAHNDEEGTYACFTKNSTT